MGAQTRKESVSHQACELAALKPAQVLLQRLGEVLKDALTSSSVPVILELDWTDSVVNPDERYGSQPYLALVAPAKQSLHT